MYMRYVIEIGFLGLNRDLFYVNGIGFFHHLSLHIRLWYNTKMAVFYSSVLDIIDEMKKKEVDENEDTVRK